MVNKEQILKLHSQGKTCQEIREALGNSLTTIRECIKEAGLSTNTRITRLDKEILNKILILVEEGRTNAEIARELHISPTTARKYTTKILGKETNSIKTHSIINKVLELTPEQEEVLRGSLLGDMCLSTTSKLHRVSITHGGEQEEYFDHKCRVFGNILGKINKTPRYDKRTQKYYNRYTVRLLAHPIFEILYNELYINGVKTITKEYLNKLTPRSLAYWFMDDGCNSGTLATNCFSKEECELIRDWLYTKYNIETTLQRNNKQYLVYIKTKSRQLFYDLVSPYFIPSMLYKINNWNLKTV